MLHRLGEKIRIASADVPDRLWPPAAVERMAAAVERFPPVRGRTIGPVRYGVMGLELRLHEGSDQVDLTFPVLREDRDAIVALGEDPEDGVWMREHPHWRRVLQLCRRWSDPEGLLGRHVKLLWFELDMAPDDGPQDDAERAATPSPGVFVGFGPETTRVLDRPDWHRLLLEVLSLLTGEEPEDGLLERFDHLRGILPVDVFVQYFGLMLSRGAAAVRFVFSGPPEPDWARFLAQAGWPGPAGELPDHLRALTAPDVERLHPGAGALQVDLTPAGLLPRFGLEYVLDRPVQVEHGIREVGFLQNLVRLGLCSPDKLEDLLRLPGRTLEPWKDLCRIGHTRQVHHVKLAFGPQGPLEAKAYYGRSLTIERTEESVPGGVPAGAPPTGNPPNP